MCTRVVQWRQAVRILHPQEEKKKKTKRHRVQRFADDNSHRHAEIPAHRTRRCQTASGVCPAVEDVLVSFCESPMRLVACLQHLVTTASVSSQPYRYARQDTCWMESRESTVRYDPPGLLLQPPESTKYYVMVDALFEQVDLRVGCIPTASSSVDGRSLVGLSWVDRCKFSPEAQLVCPNLVAGDR